MMMIVVVLVAAVAFDNYAVTLNVFSGEIGIIVAFNPHNHFS
jgi:hypothetical protein